MEINTIIFNLSEVLIAGLLGIEKPLSIALGIPEQQLFAVLGGAPLDQLFRGDSSDHDYLALLIKRNRWAVSVEFLKRILRENFRQFIPGMPQPLWDLSALYKLVLLSYHALQWITYIETIHPFLQYFHYRFFSFQIGQTKQHPGTFMIILNRIGREPGQVFSKTIMRQTFV